MNHVIKYRKIIKDYGNDSCIWSSVQTKIGSKEEIDAFFEQIKNDPVFEIVDKYSR